MHSLEHYFKIFVWNSSPPTHYSNRIALLCPGIFFEFFAILPKRFYHLRFHFIMQYSCKFLHKVTDKWFIIKNTHILYLKMENVFAFFIRRLLLYLCTHIVYVYVIYIIANGADSVSGSGLSQTTNCMGNSYMICHFLIILISPLVTRPPPPQTQSRHIRIQGKDWNIYVIKWFFV